MTVYILVYVFLNCPVRTLIISWIEGNYLILFNVLDQVLVIN